MNPKANYRVIRLEALLFALVAFGLAGCSNQFGQMATEPPPASAMGIRKVLVEVDSAPSSALISVNGLVVGSAPVNIPVEIDSLGDVARDYDLKADFADSFTGGKALQTAVVEFRINRGERPPEVVRFDTEGASAH